MDDRSGQPETSWPDEEGAGELDRRGLLVWVSWSLVASAVGELPTYFTHGSNARLVTPERADELAAELGWCLRHPEQARRMGEAARVTVLERLSPDRMLADTLRVYDS